MANFSVENKYKQGHLSLLDNIPHGDPDVGGALNMYADYINGNKTSSQWLRAVQWIENSLFGLGRQYYDNALVSRITSNSNNLSINDQVKTNIPKPTNDLLGRYVETNISLLTENRPIPRITPKGDSLEDKHAAELAELSIEFLWEELDLPEKHRELARLLLYTGIAWLETIFDPFIPRYMTLPATEETESTVLPNGIQVPIKGKTAKIDPKTGQVIYEQSMEYGDIVSNIVSGFQMHLPNGHTWNDNEMGWIMKESYTSMDEIKNKYLNPKVANIATKKNGYFLDRIEKIDRKQVHTLPLWWWERMTDIVEGPGTSMYGGTPEMWEDYTTVRVLDRKPSYKWPKGRTVILAGNQVIYDSPKSIGARAFDPRWPKRWHPYVRYRYEAQLGSMYGRSLISKLLPKLKRINSIDTCMIMWRRTVPISTWIAPKGCVIKGSKCLLLNGKVQNIETFLSGENVQSYGTTKPVIELQQYSNDEKIAVVRGKGVLPVEGTWGHKIPILRKENIIYRNREASNISKVEDVALGSIRKDDYLLSSFTRLRLNEKLNLSKYNLTGNSQINLPNYLDFNEDFLRLIGLYLAEGCVLKEKTRSNYYKGIRFTIGEHEKDTLGLEIKNLIFKVFGLNSQIKIEINKNNHTRCVVESYNIQIAQLFSKLFGEDCYTKYIHDDIFFAATSLLPLVGGWFDGDGCYNKTQKNKTFRILNGSSSSINLAYQIRGILFDEHVAVNLDVTSSKRKNPKYRLQTSSSYLEKLKPFVKKITKIEFKKTCEQGFWIDNIYFTKVKKVEYKDYVGPVYDLSIQDRHYYQVNGVIIHNTQPVEGLNSGEPGTVWTFDPNRTRGMKPEPVYPSPFPAAAMQERETQIMEMESIAGTEQILKGERPSGVNSAAMLSALRSQALASRSAILQSWDESLQLTGSALIQETIKHIKDDVYYRDRINLLAREKSSQFSIDQFSGQNLSDNVVVRIDTASMAYLAREAKQERAMQVIQYGPSLIQLPTALQSKLLNDLGWPDALVPSGPDITRARAMVQYIKAKKFELAVPMPEDDPYVMHEMLVIEIKNESFFDLNPQVQMKLYELVEYYREQIKLIEQARMQQQMQMAQMGQGGEQQ